MANDEVLGPRKTMFVLVIVVGCFAVLWPRILSPLMVGHAKDKLQPNQFDRDAGCCEVLFEKNLAILEVINEVCSSAVHTEGKLSPYAAAECRKAVNETCGLDIAAFLKRSENIGKTSKMLIETMQSSNSSCLKEHFGVPVISLSPHLAVNSWTFQDTMKQERPAIRGAGPHPALRERGRAIPLGTPPPPSRGSHITLPPNVRPPPIPGMRPPLGSPGGPVAAPKSSMGFVMPIYTICIIVFFVYTVSKIFFKRATVPYEPVTPDPQFRRRVFRDNSRTSPDKLVVTAISGLVAEVQQQMEASYAQNQQTQDGQDNHARPYTNGTVIHNSGPVHIIASEYKDKSPEQKQPSPEPRDDEKQVEANEGSLDVEDVTPESKESITELKELSPEPKSKSILEEPIDNLTKDDSNVKTEDTIDNKKPELDDTVKVSPENYNESLLIDLSKPIEVTKNGDVKHSIDEFIREEVRAELGNEKTKELLEEAIDEDQDVEQEKSTFKVMCMETRAASADGGTPPAPPPPAPALAPRSHEATDVKSIYLETEIPQQTRVLVTDFAENTRDTKLTRHAPMVVSGKMTLSLIQDAPRETPERDPESTIDDYTTASAYTQNAEKDGVESEDEGEEEMEEEVEVEEIEEEVEEEIEIDVDISDEENGVEKVTENILQRDAEKLVGEDKDEGEEERGEVEEEIQDEEDENGEDLEENHVLVKHTRDIQENDKYDVEEETYEDNKDVQVKDTQDVQENDKDNVQEENKYDILGKDAQNVGEKDMESFQDNDKQEVLKTDTEDVLDNDTEDDFEKELDDVEKELDDLLEEARSNVFNKKEDE